MYRRFERAHDWLKTLCVNCPQEDYFNNAKCFQCNINACLEAVEKMMETREDHSARNGLEHDE